MLREALDFPTSGDHGSRALLLGSALFLLTGLIVGGAAFVAETATRPLAFGVATLALLPLLAVRGYYYRAVAAAATAQHPTAPAFGGILRLFGQGLGAVVVAIGYAIPAGLMLGIAAGATQLPGSLDPNVALLGESLGAAAALFGVVALVAALYLTPAALAHSAREGSFGAAIQLRSIAGGAASEDYAVGWVLATALQWTLGPIAVGLSTLLVGIVLYFLTGVATRYVWGASYGAARGFDTPSVPREGITPSSTRADDVRATSTDTEATAAGSPGGPARAERPDGDGAGTTEAGSRNSTDADDDRTRTGTGSGTGPGPADATTDGADSTDATEGDAGRRSSERMSE